MMTRDEQTFFSTPQSDKNIKFLWVIPKVWYYRIKPQQEFKINFLFAKKSLILSSQQKFNLFLIVQKKITLGLLYTLALNKHSLHVYEINKVKSLLRSNTTTIRYWKTCRGQKDECRKVECGKGWMRKGCTPKGRMLKGRMRIKVECGKIEREIMKCGKCQKVKRRAVVPNRGAAAH